MVFGLSLLAAVCFGVSSVLQHHGANRAPHRFPLHPGLLADVAQEPWWLVGVVANSVGVVLHMLAVNVGDLSVVQPLLTVGLVVALPLQSFFGLRVRRSSLVAAALVVAGLALFLWVRPAAEGRMPQTFGQWAPGLALAAGVGLTMLTIALLSRGRVRGLGLGAVAGTFMATSAALVKTWGTLLGDGGIPELAMSWQLWTALGCGLVGTLLSLAAFQSGPLGPPLSAMMVADPILGVSLGIVLYGEPFSTGALAAVQSAGLALTLAGVWLLAHGEKRNTDRVGLEYWIMALSCRFMGVWVGSRCELVFAGESAEDGPAAYVVVGQVDHARGMGLGLDRRFARVRGVVARC